MEYYSPQMEAALRHQLQQESAEGLAALLAYFQRRGGPGLALIEAELHQRAASNQPILVLLSSSSTHCPACGVIRPPVGRRTAAIITAPAP